MTKFVFALLFICFSSLIGFSQNVKADSTGLGFALGIYNESISKNSQIFNGREEVNYNYRIEGFPYFIGREWKKGRVVYDGSEYRDVFLLFNQVTQNLVTLHFDGIRKIQLTKEIVKEFSIEGHTFINIQNNSNKSFDGFYELIVDGKVKFLARRIKVIEEIYSASRIEHKIEEYSELYLYDGVSFTRIKSKNALFSRFEDKKSEIINFIKDNKIRYNKNKELSIAKITEFYNDAQK